MSAGGKDDLAKSSVAELKEAYAASIQAAKATEHVGRRNRLIRRSSKIFQELKTRGEAREVMQRLARHSDEEVRRWAQGDLDRLDRPMQAAAPEQPPKGRFWPNVIWQSDHPPPVALARDEIAKRLRQSVPEFCDPLIALLLPAIGLWPQRRAEAESTTSRFGGAPLAPPDWRWPVAHEEPLLFVGQINCGELSGLPGAEQLPASGLLSFFGDHDAVTGCFPFDSHCVFYWPNVERLAPAKADLEPIEVFPAWRLCRAQSLTCRIPTATRLASLA